MNQPLEIPARLWAWFNKNFTWKGLLALLLWIAKDLPDWIGRRDFWGINLPKFGHFLKTWEALLVPVLVGLLIWLDHRAVLRKHHGDERLLAEPPQQATQNEVKVPLAERMTVLAKNIFLFLRECGQEDPPSLSYIVKVHDGFMLLWSPQVEAITYELGFVGIVDFTLGELIRRHHEGWSYDTIKQVAEALLTVKNKMELNSYKALTMTYRDLEQMSSDEIIRRSNSDPEFRQQAAILEAFKPPL
jgi:hypothetical protein